MTRVWFWRHGQTDYNVGLRVQGQIDIPLNEVGIEQARSGAVQLNAAIGAVPLQIVSSPLVRAAETARAVARLRNVQPIFDPRFMERAFGEFEGLTREEIVAGWPEEFAVWASGRDPEGVEMEPRPEVAERMVAAVADHTAALPVGTDLLVVSHGAAITQALTKLLRFPHGEIEPVRGIDNCHWSLVESSPAGTGATGIGRGPTHWRLRAHNVGMYRAGT